MSELLVKAAVALLRFIYVLLKPAKLRSRVLILSRQADEPSLDIKLLSGALGKRGVETVVLCRTLGSSIGSKLRYIPHILKQIRYLAGSRLVVLDGYCIAASVLPKKKGQHIVMLWHAMAAVKKFGWQNTGKPDGHTPQEAEALCMHRNYDAFLAPSEITGVFFSEAFRTPSEKCVQLCLPRVDYLRTPDPEMTQRIESTYPAVSERINVLYVPTFRKNTALMLDKLVAGFDFARYNLIIKKHFLDNNDYSWAESRGAVVDTAYSSMDWLKLCPKVVTDYSAIAFEAAILGRELYILQNDAESYNDKVGLNIELQNEAIGRYVCRTEERLFELLAEPYDTAALKSFTEKYIEAPTDNCTERICDYLLSL